MSRKDIKSSDTREKLLDIFEIFKDHTSSTKTIKIPKNYNLLFRKLYKYIKPEINLVNITFDELEEIDKEKQYLLGIDNLWMSIKLITKEWIYNLFSACSNMMENNESLNSQMEFYLLNCFNIVKEVCRKPPKGVFNFTDKLELKKELLYIILDFYIIQNEQMIFHQVFDLMIKYSENSRISYKFYVILKKFCIKYFPYLHQITSTTSTNKGEKKTIDNSKQNLISEIIDQNNEFLSIPNKKNTYRDEAFKRFIDVTINSLKANIKEVDKSKAGTSFFSIFFVKNKTLQSKELDGSNITDYFTILNTSEEYANSHINNIAVFSVCYELIKFIYNSIKVNIISEDNAEKMFWSFREMKSVLHSYCIRIFDQSENYLESNKNKNIIDKNTEYNLNLIEASVWESLKIINLICKLETSLVSNINMRMKQVYERIALKQSGLVFLEILQFFIDNCHLIIIDLDYYVSEFFKLKLKFNYKYEILSFTTLEFLYKNKEILNQKTQVFNSFFPLIIKIFATFPKYMDTKFFTLVGYMTKPAAITELFNYILDLPAIILIIENFECYTMNNFSGENSPNNNCKLSIEDIFQPEYVKLVEFLLRDIAFEQEYQFSYIYTNLFNKQVKIIFESLVFTSRVHSTTKIVPKLLKKFFDVIIQRDECESASETIILIFERFSYFHENEHYKQEIRNLLIRKLEEMFKKWPKIVTTLREKILWQIKNKFSNSTKRELICLLCWSLGEFLNKHLDNSFKDQGIKQTFDCLEKLLRDNIIFFGHSSNKDAISSINNDSVEDVLKCKINFFNILGYSTYFIDKTTEEEIFNERLLIIIINTLGKLSVKFKAYVSRIIKCFKDVKLITANKNLTDKLCEMLISLEHISIATEYLI